MRAMRQEEGTRDKGVGTRGLFSPCRLFVFCDLEPQIRIRAKNASAAIAAAVMSMPASGTISRLAATDPAHPPSRSAA